MCTEIDHILRWNTLFPTFGAHACIEEPKTREPGPLEATIAELRLTWRWILCVWSREKEQKESETRLFITLEQCLPPCLPDCGLIYSTLSSVRTENQAHVQNKTLPRFIVILRDIFKYFFYPTRLVVVAKGQKSRRKNPCEIACKKKGREEMLCGRKGFLAKNSPW